MRWSAPVLAILVLAGCGGGTDAPPAADPVAAEDVFAKPPYMGMSCATPNDPECDRVGLAVWLRHRAQSVEAEIGGRRFALDDPETGDRERMFAGYLEGAGLAARDEPSVTVVIRHEGGRPLTTTVEVPLREGWG